MTWAPQQQGLEELVACLSKSGSADNKVQESIQEVRTLSLGRHRTARSSCTS